MNSQSTIRRSLLAISTQCCLLVVVFAGLVAPSDSAAAAMMMSEQTVSSAQMLSAIEGGEGQLGGLSVWYDVALSDTSVTSMGAGSRGAGSRAGSMSSNGEDLSEDQSILKLFPSLDLVFAPSPATGSASGFSASGTSAGGAGSVTAAILVPQMRFPVPVLNHFRRGVDFLFVPPVVPDELLRPPQI